MRALGFCVSVEHARFMADQFEPHGVPARAVWGDTPEAERVQALRDLVTGALAVVFAVDLFNEGVDVPTVDTLLMLRPTESATLFLQQLGRGLRRAENGEGVVHGARLRRTAPREFRFDLRYRALLGGSRRSCCGRSSATSRSCRPGCHLELDPVARDVVLTASSPRCRATGRSGWPSCARSAT
jgi:hypothetical protein